MQPCGAAKTADGSAQAFAMPKCRPNPHTVRNLFEISDLKHWDFVVSAGGKACKNHPDALRARKAAFGETGQHIAPKGALQHQIDALPEIPCDATRDAGPPNLFPSREMANIREPRSLGVQGDQAIPFHKKFLRSYPTGVYLNPRLLE